LNEAAAVGSFSERVYAMVRRIPEGSVTTYGYVALLVDAPHGARQVGRALRELPRSLAWRIASSATHSRAKHAECGSAQTLAVPWHRVVNARGRVSPRGDGGAIAVQVALLRNEGVEVTDEGVLVRALESVGWFPEPWPRNDDRSRGSMLFDAGD
jgi:methylated-DNA-protein-cysteine methyltransferase related protein